jgi:hypothetical protein
MLFIFKALFSFLLSLFLTRTITFAESNGLLNLPAEKRFSKREAVCGLVDDKWLSGSNVKGHFYPHKVEISILRRNLKKVKGNKRKAIDKRIKSLVSKQRLHSKICAPGPDEVATPTPSPTEAPKVAKGPVKFNLEGISGLSVNETIGGFASTSSNLKGVTKDGALIDVVKSAKVLTVARVFIASNKKVYLTFKSPINLANGEEDAKEGCFFVEIDSLASGDVTPTCLESGARQILWQEERGLSGAKNPPVQIDELGRIYYVVTNLPTASPIVIIKRYENGSAKELINEDINLADWQVRGDGTLFITGKTPSSKLEWIKTLSPLGVSYTVNSTSQANYLKIFPDRRPYFGFNNFFIGMYRTFSDGLMEEKPWIDYYFQSQSDLQRVPYYDIASYCFFPYPPGRAGLCASRGSLVKDFHQMGNFMYAVIGYQIRGTLTKVYPEVELIESSIKEVNVIKGVGTTMFIAGTRANEKNSLTGLDLFSLEEIPVIGDEEIEIYRLSYSNKAQTLFFDGLRFIDNKYVIGTYHLPSGKLNVVPTGEVRFKDFAVLK